MLGFLKQIFRFSIVGILAFGIDYGLLVALTEVWDMHYLLSAAVSFTVSTIFNYVYSMKYVFSGRGDMSSGKQFTIFVILSLCGLVLNTVLMNWCVERIVMHYMLAKLVSALIVSVWNFVTRKIFLEEKSINQYSENRHDRIGSKPSVNAGA